MLRLPVSGLGVSLRLPTGAEDILLLEAARLDVRIAIELLGRVVETSDGSPIAWSEMSLTDLDALLLRLRQRVLGDVVRADISCSAPECRTRVDIVFSIDAYLEHHRPQPPANVEAVDRTWFRLTDGELQFRTPNAGDQIAIELEADPEQALVLRCVNGESVSVPQRERVEEAMEAIAPSLYGELEGICPECGAHVTADFDPLRYTLRELRSRATYVYDDVCTIARYTHWREADILALPTLRRARYAELVQNTASA